MINVKKSNERGYADHGWLKSYHSFSFANYYDPNNMNFSDLRVINDDTIEATYGFGTHPHKNMEIFTYVVSGALQHKDTLGNGAVINSGDVQLMSTGYGVQHSEFNSSETTAVHLLQVWIMPSKTGTKPSYQQTHFSKEDKLNKLKLIISESGRDQSLQILQDVSIYASILESGQHLDYLTKEDRSIYIQIVSGQIEVNGVSISTGDAAMVKFEEALNIKALSDSEFLLFDLSS